MPEPAATSPPTREPFRLLKPIDQAVEALAKLIAERAVEKLKQKQAAKK